MSDKDIENLRKTVVDSSDSVKIDLTYLAEKKKQVIIALSKRDLDEETIDKLCQVLTDKK